MTEIIAIGLNTFREAIRNKVLYLILMFALLLLVSSTLLSSLALEEGMRVIKNLGLSSINVFGLLVAMFIGVNLIPQEVESKTIYTIISQGVRRWQFVLGKFLGLTMTVYANMAVMTFMLLLIMFWFLGGFSHPFTTLGDRSFMWVTAAIGMQLFEMLIVISIAILFSSFSTPILSAVMTLMVYAIGHMTNDFWDYIRLQTEKVGTNLFTGFLTFIWYLCPHLDLLNLKKLAVYYELLPAAQTYFPLGPAVLHSLTYSALVLGLGCVAFSKRDF
ncbi:MAG: ABC transporter permease subunit [Candidatus Omnitrophica bacterium]|nr:ABC transporter permease subunit [Candidatus Omnitrophota bacterium]MCL4734870.1 ABC transporter permease subunit [Candidatus Omnitrophota bacterium]